MFQRKEEGIRVIYTQSDCSGKHQERERERKI